MPVPEKQFNKFISWLRHEHATKRNSIVIVLPNDEGKNEGWHIDKFLGDTIKLQDSKAFNETRNYRYRQISREDFNNIETLLDRVYISVSKENIMKDYKSYKE